MMTGDDDNEDENADDNSHTHTHVHCVIGSPSTMNLRGTSKCVEKALKILRGTRVKDLGCHKRYRSRVVQELRIKSVALFLFHFQLCSFFESQV